MKTATRQAVNAGDDVFHNYKCIQSKSSQVKYNEKA